MTHVRQELTLTPIRQLSRFPSRRVLLNTKVRRNSWRCSDDEQDPQRLPIPQVENHVVDLGLQTVHLSASLDRNKPREVSIHSCSRNLGETSDLRRQVASHSVDGESGGND